MEKATYQIDYGTVKAIVRERYAVWIAIYAEIESRARELQHNRLFPIDSLQHLLVMALFARTVSNTSAAILVVEHGYNVQCKALLRTALESMFTLAAIAKNPKMAETFAQSGDRETKRKVFKSRLWSKSLRAPLASRFSSETFKKAEDIAKSKTKIISTEEMAKMAGLHDWYLTAYTIFSDAVHGNIHDLNQQFVRSEDGEEIEGVRCGAIVDDLHGLYLCASEVLLKGLEAMDDVFQFDTVEFRARMMERVADAVKQHGR